MPPQWACAVMTSSLIGEAAFYGRVTVALPQDSLTSYCSPPCSPPLPAPPTPAYLSPPLPAKGPSQPQSTGFPGPRPLLNQVCLLTRTAFLPRVSPPLRCLNFRRHSPQPPPGPLSNAFPATSLKSSSSSPPWSLKFVCTQLILPWILAISKDDSATVGSGSRGIWFQSRP